MTDIDADEPSKYVQHSIAYLAYLEEKQLPAFGPTILANAGVKPTWRLVLIDWLRDISEKLRLLSETFYMAVALLDRFYDQVDEPVPKNQVQKTGVTALFLAAKFEEIYP